MFHAVSILSLYRSLRWPVGSGYINDIFTFLSRVPMNKRKKNVTTILTKSPISIETSCFHGSRILRGSVWRGTRVQSLTTFSKHSQNRSVSVLLSEYKLKIRDQGNNMS